MKNKKHILIFSALLLVLLAVPVWGRAGGGGSSGGGGGGSIVLIRKARAARARSQKAMAFYAQLGDNWDYREIQR